MVIEQHEVVTYVCDKIVEIYKDVDVLPDKLDIHRAMSRIAANTQVRCGTKQVKKGFDPETGKPKFEEEEVIKPLISYYTKMSLNEVKACQERILKEMAKVKYPEIKEQGNFVELLKQLKAYAWNIRSEDIVDFLIALLKFAHYAKTGEERIDDLRYEEAIYLKGEVEGGGKSTLIHAIVDGAKEVGLKADNAYWPTGRFGNVMPFCNSNIAYIEDCDNNIKKEIIDCKMKSILRKENVENEMKGLSPVNMEVKSSFIAAGNCEPPVSKDRCWKIFDVIPVDISGNFGKSDLFQKIKEQTAQYPDGIKDLYLNYSFYLFYYLLLKLKENENNNDSIKRKEDNNNPQACSLIHIQKRAKSLPTLLSILNKMNECDTPVDFHKISAKQICDFAEAAGMQYDSWKIISTLKLLYSNEIIDVVARQSGNEIYSKYDLKGLEGIKAEDLFTDCEENSLSVTEEILENQKKWDELIEYFTNIHPDEDKPTNNETTNNEEEENMTIEEATDKLEEVLTKESIKENQEKEDSKMDLEKATYSVKGWIKEDFKGKRYVLQFTDKRDNTRKYYKTYWLYDEEGFKQGPSNEFSSDMKQIWMSKGRMLETDEEWARFAERMINILKGKQQLYIDSSCYLEVDPKNNIKKIWADLK